MTPYVEYRQVTDDDLLKMTIMNKSVLTDEGCWDKLTADQVTVIRSSGLTNRKLASKFGVGIIAVRRARIGETWKQVPTHSDMGA